jgi:hypothetical protein
MSLSPRNKQDSKAQSQPRSHWAARPHYYNVIFSVTLKTKNISLLPVQLIKVPVVFHYRYVTTFSVFYTRVGEGGGILK